MNKLFLIAGLLMIASLSGANTETVPDERDWPHGAVPRDVDEAIIDESVIEEMPADQQVLGSSILSKYRHPSYNKLKNY